MSTSAIALHSHTERARSWLEGHRGRRPLFACVLGFTETGLIPGISAAGKTPRDRRFTALADAEFLHDGIAPQPRYPLPPLQSGVSPTFISRAAIEALEIPLQLFDAGLAESAPVPAIDLGGAPARCLSTGRAMNRETVRALFDRSLAWGERLAGQADYLAIGECVVGGTSTALAVLCALGYRASGKVNSSHPLCNHAQKQALVAEGVQRARLEPNSDPLEIVAAVGDPMQVAVAAMAIAASRTCGVMLAGGTQMLAVYALARAIANWHDLDWQRDRLVVGTTRWVAEDASGDTVSLARETEAALVAAQLNFAPSRYPQLQAYERGFVKEGVGAGGCAILSHLYGDWSADRLRLEVEGLLDRYGNRPL